MDLTQRITTLDELRQLYRRPSTVTVNKERPTIDDASRQFIERCRFAVVGTFDRDGNPDVSPRGGPSGFVRVLNPNHIAVADLGGNNRLDTLQNVVATGRAAFVFVVPGQSETVRMNGRAWISIDAEVLAAFDLPRVPKAALVMSIDTTYVHCAKAFHRSGMWDPAVWADLADTPDGAEILSCQAVVDADPSQMRTWLDDGYREDLAAES